MRSAWEPPQKSRAAPLSTHSLASPSYYLQQAHHDDARIAMTSTLEERVDQARTLLCEGASLLVCQEQQQQQVLPPPLHTGPLPTTRFHQCLDKFDRALQLAPHLRAHAVSMGVGGREYPGPIDLPKHGHSPYHTPPNTHSGSVALPSSSWARSGKPPTSSPGARHWTRTTASPTCGGAWYVLHTYTIVGKGSQLGMPEGRRPYACGPRTDPIHSATLLPSTPQCIAKLHGWAAAQQALEAFTGYDNRLCMMEVVNLYQDKATVEEVLDCACGDFHSAARASFACALYFEARGQVERMALPLLQAVADLDCGGDTYLRSLAFIHLQQLRQGSTSSSTSCTPTPPSKRPAAVVVGTPPSAAGRNLGGLGVVSVHGHVSPPVCGSPAKPAVFRTALARSSC